MALVILSLLATLMILLNKSRYLREYQSNRLPPLGVLVLLLAVPLVILDHQVTDFWLRSTWLILFVTGGLASFIDWERHLLPDRLIVPALVASILLLGTADGFGSKLVGGVVGGLGWFTVFALLALISPTGLGWGDVKFAALLGLACGAVDLKLVPVAILLASAAGGIYALIKIVQGNRRSPIPFGPFMFLGAIASLISG